MRFPTTPKPHGIAYLNQEGYRGESGLRARECQTEWIFEIVSQCQAAGVPCFVKQLGANAVGRGGRGDRAMFYSTLHRGPWNDPAEWPEWARVRNFPESHHG